MLKKLTFLLIVSTILVFLTGCSSAQINKALKDAQDMLGTSSKPTTEEVVAGLKQALINGINIGAANASKANGYLGNPAIKIPLPPDIQNIESRLRQVGLGGEVDKFLETLNRGAEEAAKEAAPIFVNAIRSMTIRDAWDILNGSSNEATVYLEKTTYKPLYQKFLPVVQEALKKTKATSYYTDVVNTYNRIPGVQRINPDLDDYATNQAIDGLFYLIAQEEAKIRMDPAARTTAILKKVFGYEGN